MYNIKNDHKNIKDNTTNIQNNSKFINQNIDNMGGSYLQNNDKKNNRKTTNFINFNGDKMMYDENNTTNNNTNINPHDTTSKNDNDITKNIQNLKNFTQKKFYPETHINQHNDN